MWLAMMPGDFAREAAQFYPLDIYPLPFDFPEQQIYMIWKKQRNSEPGHQWLRQQILSALEEKNVPEHK